MSRPSKQLSNPFSTGGGGPHFEACVQAMFVTLMLTGGHAPCLPNWPIKRIKLQGKNDGFEMDDAIVFVENPISNEKRKLATQVKHSIRITAKNKLFGEVMQAAWKDFNNTSLFDRRRDAIALITGPLSATDTNDVVWLLDQARHTVSPDEFLRNVGLGKFSSRKKREKLEAFKQQLRNANQGGEVPSECLYSFLKCFHLLGYDLGREVGTALSLLHSHMSQYDVMPSQMWGRIVGFAQSCNQNAGTIEHDGIPDDIREAFEHRIPVAVPRKFTEREVLSEESDWNQSDHASALVVANLVGAWDEKNKADIDIIRRLNDSQ